MLFEQPNRALPAQLGPAKPVRRSYGFVLAVWSGPVVHVVARRVDELGTDRPAGQGDVRRADDINAQPGLGIFFVFRRASHRRQVQHHVRLVGFELLQHLLGIGDIKLVKAGSVEVFGQFADLAAEHSQSAGHEDFHIQW